MVVNSQPVYVSRDCSKLIVEIGGCQKSQSMWRFIVFGFPCQKLQKNFFRHTVFKKHHMVYRQICDYAFRTYHSLV